MVVSSVLWVVIHREIWIIPVAKVLDNKSGYIITHGYAIM